MRFVTNGLRREYASEFCRNEKQNYTPGARFDDSMRTGIERTARVNEFETSSHGI